jgi:hypothetical protein
MIKMTTLDFSQCKTKEDVDKVFQKESSTLRNAKAMMDRVQNPQNYCNICGKKIGVCRHTKARTQS